MKIKNYHKIYHDNINWWCNKINNKNTKWPKAYQFFLFSLSPYLSSLPTPPLSSQTQHCHSLSPNYNRWRPIHCCTITVCRFITSSTLPVFSSHFHQRSRAPISSPPCASTDHLSPPHASFDPLLSCDSLCYRAIIACLLVIFELTFSPKISELLFFFFF